MSSDSVLFPRLEPPARPRAAQRAGIERRAARHRRRLHRRIGGLGATLAVLLGGLSALHRAPRSTPQVPQPVTLAGLSLDHPALATARPSHRAWLEIRSSGPLRPVEGTAPEVLLVRYKPGPRPPERGERRL